MADHALSLMLLVSIQVFSGYCREQKCLKSL